MDPVNSHDNELIAQLEELAKDKRLERVFSESDSKPCALQLWLLELAKDKNKEYLVLYGWIIPTTYRSKDWTAPDSGKLERAENDEFTYKYRVCRINLYRSGRTILDIIKKMCEGSTLNKACEELGIKNPKNNFGEVMLGDSKEEINKLFAVRPPIFLETKQSVEMISQNVRPAISPSRKSPSFVASLFLLKKDNLWAKTSENIQPQVNELMKKCLTDLAEETGLDFLGSDSVRLGNIEWITLPTIDEYENAKVIFYSIPKELVKNGKKTVSVRDIMVIIRKGALENGTEILVRCRLRDSGGIIHDQCKESVITNGDNEFNFNTTQEIGNVLISIWNRKGKEESWIIWYEDSCSLINSLEISIGIGGLQGTLKSYRFNGLEQSRAKEKLEKVQKLEKVNYSERLVIGERQLDPWRQASNVIGKKMSLLFAKTSSGGFFPKGWGEEGPGLLSFFEWFIDISKDSKTSKIIIIDPYFDEAGVELIARAKGTHIEYIVLTSTQHREDAVKRLRGSLKQTEVIFSRMKFQLLDLKSKGRNEKQLFHDRYIVILDNDNSVIKGFNLSNSIQNATKNFPMLATPIPSDLLNDVLKYVNDLTMANAPTVENAEVKTIFDSGQIITEKNKKVEFIDYPLVSIYFSILLNDKGLSSFSKLKLKRHLKKLGLINEKDNPIASAQIKLRFDLLGKRLKKCKQDEFNKLWCCFGRWLSYVSQAEEYLHEIFKVSDKHIVNKLHRFLVSSVDSEPALGSLDIEPSIEKIGVLHYFRMDFANVLREAEIVFMFNYYYYRFGNYGIYYATHALNIINPHSFISTIEELTSMLPKSDNDPKSIRMSLVLAMSIAEIVKEFEIFGTIRLLPELICSNVPFLRAVGVRMIIKSSLKKESKKDLAEYFNILQKLDESEQIHSLCEWIWSLDRPNAANGKEDFEILDHIRAIVIDGIKDVWPKNMAQDGFFSIIVRLTGESGNVRSNYTVNNILLPLVDLGKLKLISIADFWLDSMRNILSTEVKFYASHDQEFTDVCGWFLANTPQEYRQFWLKNFEERMNSAFRILYHPFSESKDFNSWRNAINVLLWLQTLINFTILHARKNSNFSKDELDTLKMFVTLTEGQLDKYDEERLKGLNDLFSVASHVKKLVEE